MRDRVADLAAKWRRERYELNLGLGIARGYAALGAIGFEGRWDHAAREARPHRRGLAAR